MGFLKKRRFKKVAETMAWHVGSINQLVLARLGDLDDAGEYGASRFTKSAVLAKNYEMASHAARALTCFREMQETSGVGTTQDVRETRQWLAHFVDIPAMSYRDTSTAPDAEIDRLWGEFVSYKPTKLPSEHLALAAIALHEIEDRDE